MHEGLWEGSPCPSSPPGRPRGKQRQASPGGQQPRGRRSNPCSSAARGPALGKFTAHVVPLSFDVPPGKLGGVPTCTPSWPQGRPQSGWSPWSLSCVRTRKEEAGDSRVERRGERAPLTGGETEAQRGTEVYSGAPSRSEALGDGGRGWERLPAPRRPILSSHPGDDGRCLLWDVQGLAWAV